MPAMMRIAALLAVALFGACASVHPRRGERSNMEAHATVHSFADDLAFLRQHTEIVVLSSEDGLSQVAVAPQYQGRVMTSTLDGPAGASAGYVHRPGVELAKPTPHMTVLGGEDRFWLGPEGGQFGLYFAPGAPFDLAHWQVPGPIDWGGWPIVARTPRSLDFQTTMELVNRAGTRFRLRVDRTVRLLTAEDIARVLGAPLPEGMRAVGFETDNRITNLGSEPLSPATGLVSIWILGMYPPAPRATVVIPFRPGSEQELGPIVNDRYFGAIGPDRLKVGERALFFRADGNQRGKIGVPRPRARPVAGSYDPDARRLTLVQFTLPETPREYVNSMWEEQAEPYAGDVVNSYNDGPLGPDAPPLGPFYEIESSSPAMALAPLESVAHVHRTLHLAGSAADLDQVARSQLGVSLAEVHDALPR
jgi:hypothetical protein